MSEREIFDQSSETLSSHQLSNLPQPVVDPGANRPSRSSNGRSRGSRRSHGHRTRSSGSRSRSRHHHGSRNRHSRSGCRLYLKHQERNFAAATSSMITIVLLCISLEPDLIYMKGGGCYILNSPKGSTHHLSATQFFYSGHFYKNFYPLTDAGDTVYQFSSSSNDIMVNCVTLSAVILIKTSIAFTLIAVLFSAIAFLLDLIGPQYRLLKALKRNALFNILTVILCVTVNLFSYWITTSVNQLQHSSRMNPGSRVEVGFDVSFYLVTAAGAMSVIATACNCLRRHSVYETAEPQRQAADHFYFDDTETLLPPSPDVAPLSNLPPPPAYSP